MSTEAEEAVGERPALPARRLAVLVLLVTAAVSVTIDQVSKHLAVVHLDYDESVRLLGGALYLSLTRNSGAAFSLGSDYTFVFPLITCGVIAWIVWMALKLRSVPWGLALGFVLGGALGNATDRIFRAPGPLRGHVVDMFSLFGPNGEHWPIFNVADMSLICGVVLAIGLEFTGRQRDGSRVRAKRAVKE
ncbi:signal peptidase II [Phytohabitans flavus]|uniref:signal peptidase II n=1 Tax=Phytohabitans flavus TaxID=1076124 RepID=UPI001E2F3250|nr:signal peptidase II [Phytohabitans flavus]